MMRSLVIRVRHDSDVEPLCDLVRSIHETDGYPVVIQDDTRSFILTENGLAAWVCEIDGRVAGHVALHAVWSDEVAFIASAALELPRTRLGAVSRLFVDRTARRRGIARTLLDEATREARARGLYPVLDVVTTYAPAVALYERAGWKRLGTIGYPMPDGSTMAEHVYAAALL
jgi:GNAT superfamily N-acetyltransferase